MQRLADEVDAAIGTVYTYFPSKGALARRGAARGDRPDPRQLPAPAARRRGPGGRRRPDHRRRRPTSWRFGRFWIASLDTLPAGAAPPPAAHERRRPGRARRRARPGAARRSCACSTSPASASTRPPTSARCDPGDADGPHDHPRRRAVRRARRRQARPLGRRPARRPPPRPAAWSTTCSRGWGAVADAPRRRPRRPRRHRPPAPPRPPPPASESPHDRRPRPPSSPALALLAIGAAAWTLGEYLMHRFAMHALKGQGHRLDASTSRHHAEYDSVLETWWFAWTGVVGVGFALGVNSAPRARARSAGASASAGSAATASTTGSTSGPTAAPSSRVAGQHLRALGASPPLPPPLRPPHARTTASPPRCGTWSSARTSGSTARSSVPRRLAMRWLVDDAGERAPRSTSDD